MSAYSVNKTARNVLLLTAILFILLLASINIEQYLTPKKVLGVETIIDPAEVFWQEFLNKNPNYISGWIEIGRMDKAREIDPNYEIR